MGRPTPETGGGNPYNIDLKTLRVAPEERRFGSSFKKPEEPVQQPSSPNNELSEYYSREQERHSGILVNRIRVPRPLPRKPGEQRGETEPYQPNPAEQQAAERLGKPPPKPEAEQDTVQRFAEVQEKLKRFPEDVQKRIRRVYFNWVLERYKDDIGFHQPGRIMEMIEMLDEIIEIYSRELSEK
jgi:hypothetical protein